MSRARAAVFGPSRQQSKREQQLQARQALRDRKRALAQPEAESKPSLAERVLPWRKRKAQRDHAQREAERLAQIEQLQGLDQYEQTRGLIRESQRPWVGKLTFRERQRLFEIGRKSREGENPPTFDHPQQRRIERQMRREAVERASARRDPAVH